MNCTFDASERNLVCYSFHVLFGYVYMLFYEPMHIWSVSVKNQLEVLSVQAQAQVPAPCQPARPPSSDSVLSCLHPSSQSATRANVCLPEKYHVTTSLSH